MRKRVVISDQGKPYILNGQDWMYINNLVEKQDCDDGEIVDIYDEEDQYVATGFYSAKSHIAVRVFDRDNLENYDIAYFKEKLKEAIDYRKEIMGDNFDNCRLVYGEADGLPGLILDRYNNILVTQISCKGMEDIKEEIYNSIFDILEEYQQEITGIYERNDIKAREKEGLETYKGFYHGLRLMPRAVINENGIDILVDVANGQKTGYFLDQKDNRLTVRGYAEGKKVLDCFCHTGGFGLNAAKGKAKAVTCVDVSEKALETAKKIAGMNDLEGIMEFVQDDVFKYLDKVQKGQFDMIILDPPAFTKSRSTVMQAYNGYLNINAKAMKLLDDGGLLVTCSCSRYMERADFEKMLSEAGNQANIEYQILNYAAASKDHRIDKANSESDYLKFYVLQINGDVK